MSLVELRKSYALRAAALAIAAAAFAAPAMAATAVTTSNENLIPTTISPETVNVLNLLSPYLTLNSNSTGENTLQANLIMTLAHQQQQHRR